MKNTLETLHMYRPPLIRSIVINGVLTNEFIFPFKEALFDLFENKKTYLTKLENYKNEVLKVLTNGDFILEREKKEVFDRIEFFKQVYDVEANKLDRNWEV